MTKYVLQYLLSPMQNLLTILTDHIYHTGAGRSMIADTHNKFATTANCPPDTVHPARDIIFISCNP